MTSILKVSEIQDPTNSNTALSIDTSGNVTFNNPPINVGMTHVGSVSATTAAIDALHINGCLSADYDYYQVFYRVNRPGTTGAYLYIRFGNGGTLISTSTAVRGAMQHYQLNATGGNGKQYYFSSQGVHQIHGSVGSVANEYFSGECIIMNPFSSSIPTAIKSRCIMYQQSSEANKWFEESGSSEDVGDAASATDIRMGVVVGSSVGSDITASATFGAVDGNVTVFGVKT